MTAPWQAQATLKDPFAPIPLAWEDPPVEPRDLIGALRSFGVVAVALTLVGAPLGVLWALLSPPLDLVAVANGSEDAFRVQLSADLVLGVLAVVVGVAAGVLAWTRRPRHGAAVVLGLAVGGLLAGLVAARVGYLYELPGLRESVRPDIGQQTLDLVSFRLRAQPVLVVLPLVAVGAFAALLARAPRQPS